MTHQLSIPREVIADALKEWLVPATENGEIDELWNAFLDELAPYGVQIARRVLSREMPRRIDDTVMLTRVGETLTRIIDELELVTRATLEDSQRLGDIINRLRDWAYTIGNRPSATPSEMAVPAAVPELLARGDVP